MFNWKKNNIKEVTIITSLINLGRENLNTDFKRSYTDYLNRFAELLSMPNNMIVYVDELAYDLVLKHRNKDNTKLILITKETLLSYFPYKNNCDEIRKSSEWLNQTPWLMKSPQAQLEWYNPMVFSKLKMLAESAKDNPFNTSHFYWLDAGIAQTVHPGYFYHDKVFYNQDALKNEFQFVAFPYFNPNEIHGFKTEGMKELIKTNQVNYVVRGGFFGGEKSKVIQMEKWYSEELKIAFQLGLMGTEESIFTILSYKYPNHCTTYFIESNGLLSTYFEALKNNKINELSSLPNPELDTNSNSISKEDINHWHHHGYVHFQKTLNTLSKLISNKSELNYIDVGSSTGAFYLALKNDFLINKSLLIEPSTRLSDYSKQVVGDGNVKHLNMACGSENTSAYLHETMGENVNLGIFSVIDESNSCAIPVQIKTLSDIINENEFNDVNLIKIHTPSLQKAILEGLLNYIQTADKLPVIVFDYGYYESKDVLHQLLNQFYHSGYQAIDLYSHWGNDLFLIPQPDKLSYGITLNSLENSIKIVHKQHLTSTYIVTYNFPQQFKMLMNSFEQSASYLLNKTNLIVLNNSDDENTDTDYKQLFKKYNFEEIKLGNLGICGGRQYIAEHFDKTNAEQMFFFEDDMLLHEPQLNVCKNGFPTWLPDLFEKSIEILNMEQFDFLKLCFTEFYGDNKTQWAWYNVPQQFRETHFKDHPFRQINGEEMQAPQTVFNHIKNHQGISYINGEIFYCNWPHVIGKKGNKKMFLDVKWDYPYEQTWMSHFFQMTVKGELNPGLLLASPINHNREFHYLAESRKENNPKIKY